MVRWCPVWWPWDTNWWSSSNLITLTLSHSGLFSLVMSLCSSQSKGEAHLCHKTKWCESSKGCRSWNAAPKNIHAAFEKSDNSTVPPGGTYWNHFLSCWPAALWWRAAPRCWLWPWCRCCSSSTVRASPMCRSPFPTWASSRRLSCCSFPAPLASLSTTTGRSRPGSSRRLVAAAPRAWKGTRC